LGAFCVLLVHFFWFWYHVRFGIMYQEQSGNPAADVAGWVSLNGDIICLDGHGPENASAHQTLKIRNDKIIMVVIFYLEFLKKRRCSNRANMRKG
jgi:hypothetical protein